jgi:dolichyl-phosphate beta-glucosyltransferase
VIEPLGAAPAAVIVVPCYNEAARLRGEEFLSFAQTTEATRLLFVDDGSTDGTGAVIDALASRSDGRIIVLTLPANGGKGAAVHAGLRYGIELGADIVGYFDADLATPLEELRRLIEVRRVMGSDVVIGSRVRLLGHEIDRSPRRHYLGRVFATAASIVLRLPVYDTQCGAKLFRASPALESALAVPFKTRWVFDVELLARLVATDPQLRCLEVPLMSWHDMGGSKLTVSEMLGAMLELLRLAARQKADALRSSSARR